MPSDHEQAPVKSIRSQVDSNFSSADDKLHKGTIDAFYGGLR